MEFSGNGRRKSQLCDQSISPAPAHTTPGSVGNVGRNTLIGPHFVSQDFAVLKNFPIGQSQRLQFRAEFFNFFNHTNFKLPENRLDQSGVGKIGDAYDPRLIQFGLRLEW